MAKRARAGSKTALFDAARERRAALAAMARERPPDIGARMAEWLMREGADVTLDRRAFTALHHAVLRRLLGIE